MVIWAVHLHDSVPKRDFGGIREIGANSNVKVKLRRIHLPFLMVPPPVRSCPGSLDWNVWYMDDGTLLGRMPEL